MKEKVLFFITLGLTTIVFSEITLRILRPRALEFYRIQKLYHKFDADYFVDLEPNVNMLVKHFLGFYEMKFSTNEFGFRGTRKIENNSAKIGCMGDSITMGFGVNDEDTFCARLDNQVFSGKTYQSVNLAVDAYGPAALSVKWKKYAKELKLDLLYYFPSGGDDIDDDAFYQRKQNFSDYFFFKMQFLLTKHSYFFLGLKIAQEQLIYRFKETFVWPVEKANRTLTCGGIPDSEKCKDIYHYSFHDFLKEFTVPSAQDNDTVLTFPDSECIDKPDPFIIPQRMQKDLESILQTSRETGTKIVFVLTPTDTETAFCSQRGKLHRYYGYFTSLKQFLKERNVPFIDLNHYTERMKDDKGRLNVRPYYIPNDGHYTVKGNQWVFELLQENTGRFLQ